MKPTYLELSARTAAPVGPCRDRLHSALLALLYAKLREFSELTGELDQLKRAIFYGNPDVTGNMTLPTDAAENAQHALREDIIVDLLHSGLGLATEAGEFLDDVFGHLFEGHGLNMSNLKIEVGDTQWYLAQACRALGTTLEAEQDANIAKLAARYGEKFSDVAALNRNLDAETKAVEESAKLIYEQMRSQDPEGAEYPWVDGGNSLKQQEARHQARIQLK